MRILPTKKLQWLFLLIPLFLMAGIGYRIFTSTPIGEAKSRLQALELVEVSSDIFLDEPEKNAVVTSPLLVSGKAYSDDGALYWRIRDEDNVILAADSIALETSTEWTTFEAEIFLPEIGNHLAVLEVYTKKAGNLDEAVLQRGLLVESTEVMVVQVYYIEASKAEEGDCTATAYQERRFGFTEQTELATLIELLEGPTATWALNKVPAEAGLVSVTRNENSVRVEFTKSTVDDWFIEDCDVSPGFLQITQTLEQFDGVEEVEIWIDGVELTAGR